MYLWLIHKLLNVFPELKIIIDESFIHFSNDYDNWKSKRLELLNNKNTFFIKSMSKDFGIAGLRIGFMETQNDIIYDLKNRFGTWSINNLAVELLSIISETSFLSDYEFVRKKYLKDKEHFLSGTFKYG